MDNDIRPVIAAMAGGEREQLGWFDYELATGSWTWSAALFRMHGFEPGEIVPSTAIFVSHKHPEDRVRTDGVLAEVLETGQAFCCRHRIITSRRETRTVVTIGQGELDDTGAVARVRGYFVDITDATAAVSQQMIREAVAHSAAAREVIEQAKGALMVVQGVSPEDAFAVLRWHSSHGNVKIRDLAQLIVDAIQQPYAEQETPNQRLGRLLNGVIEESPRPERGIAAMAATPAVRF